MISYPSRVKGHAAPVLYAAWAEAGFVKESDLLNLRKIDCDLEGHPTPVSSRSFLQRSLLPKAKILSCKSYMAFFVFGFFKSSFLFSHQKLEFVDVATGSLGQGLGAACGMAYTGKNFDKSRFVFVNNVIGMTSNKCSCILRTSSKVQISHCQSMTLNYVVRLDKCSFYCGAGVANSSTQWG